VSKIEIERDIESMKELFKRVKRKFDYNETNRKIIRFKFRRSIRVLNKELSN